jgi:hypothetical protein
MSVEACVSFAQLSGWKYAGVEAGEYVIKTNPYLVRTLKLLTLLTMPIIENATSEILYTTLLQLHKETAISRAQETQQSCAEAQIA